MNLLTLTIPISLLILHFLGDFILQSDWMALNKSNLKNPLPLLAHVLVYSTCFILSGTWPFIVWVFLTHLITDAITSNITKVLWVNDQRHWFFVMIGIDQLIHYLTLAILYKLIITG